ncbi:IS5 family transposase [Psychrobacter sp. AOP22-C1-C5]|uniref:IS5 family transposase n=1 Tax=Psychrobacter sp. AOP22-C1-C5 TaxID=3457716 RepID=UPI00403542DA
MGRSKGGLTTKIHTRTDAIGNPTGFYLTGGAAHDLCGSDELLDVSISQTWFVDKACDADARVIELIKAVQGNAVIPSKCHRLQPRDFDKELYKARQLIENFFAKIKQYRAIATRYDKLACHFLSAIHLVSCVTWLN